MPSNECVDQAPIRGKICSLGARQEPVRIIIFSWPCLLVTNQTRTNQDIPSDDRERF